MADTLEFGPLPARTFHLCVDMQRLFSTEGPWPTPWMSRVLPRVTALTGFAPDRTIFTRFIPPSRAEAMPGMWRRYYEAWPEVTGERLDPAMLGLMPELAAFVPPARVVNKTRYSAFSGSGLSALLQEVGCEAVLLSGAETDMCLLATLLGVVDRGYRAVVVSDAVCSSSDEGHDMLLTLYRSRFGQQIEVAETEAVLTAWAASRDVFQ